LIRVADASDAETVLGLIDALADYEELARPTEDARGRLKAHGWPIDGSRPLYTAWLSIDDSTGEAAGYAITFITYSTFLARPTMYLEDLFVLPEFRRAGHGKALIQKVVECARESDCGRVEWVVLDWNTSAQEFYQGMGASHLTEWLHYRLTL
jgi:GNAT superfamily N-acetyltransferase